MATYGLGNGRGTVRAANFRDNDRAPVGRWLTCPALEEKIAMAHSMTTRAARIHRQGGPEVLQIDQVELPDPGPGEVRVHQTAIGLNFADVYQRRGGAGPYGVVTFPGILGSQGAGVVEAVGSGVTDVAVGDVVGYAHPGAYVVDRLLPAGRVVKLPAGMSADIAAAWLLRGMTAEYLLRRLYRVQPGETILVHAAAGGMGIVLSQWAKALGARVIGTVGSPEKAELARSYGCDEVIDYRGEDFVERVAQLTGGAGVSIVYDGVGHDVFFRSMDCLRVRGWLVNYGATSGQVGPFDLGLLNPRALIITKPSLRSYTATTEELRACAADFFSVVADGAVKLEISRRYRLEDVSQAHEDLESRRTVGASILVP